MSRHDFAHSPLQNFNLQNCPKCAIKMWLARIEPHDKPDHDLRTFECPQCDHAESVVIKFR